MLQIPINRRFS